MQIFIIFDFNRGDRNDKKSALLGSLARQPCPAALPGSLARQPCPAALLGSSTNFDRI
jgi:hypothetical protein